MKVSAVVVLLCKNGTRSADCFEKAFCEGSRLRERLRIPLCVVGLLAKSCDILRSIP